MMKALIQILDALFNLAIVILLLRIFLNEISPSPFSTMNKLLHMITEPVLAPIRKILPLGLKDKFYIDISPVIAILLIIILKFLTAKTLLGLFLEKRVRLR